VSDKLFSLELALPRLQADFSLPTNVKIHVQEVELYLHVSILLSGVGLRFMGNFILPYE
jgi:hypothetical protein